MTSNPRQIMSVDFFFFFNDDNEVQYITTLKTWNGIQAIIRHRIRHRDGMENLRFGKEDYFHV